ncbi:MAG: DNA methylase [Clostridiales bacterium]|nr:DNA methylase [Clostridiales bacterium]
MERTYIAIDLKSFYASVECVERGLDPLNTNLVVADASRTEKTICLAVSPSLKQYGLPGRARLFEVVEKVKQINTVRQFQAPKRLFSGKSYLASELAQDPSLELDYVVATPQMARYMQVSVKIFGVYLRFVAPEDIFAYSIDEVFIDCTTYLKMYKISAHDFAMKMVRAVLDETGITATAGIGTNMYLCKVAMDIVAKHIPADKDGVRIAELDEEKYKDELWAHEPLTDFWRVGRGISARLAKCGVRTMGDIARLSLTREGMGFLQTLFGKNTELLVDHAWGIEPATMADVKAYKPQNNSISSGQVLTEPTSYEHTRLIVWEMADVMSLDLVEKGLVTDQLVLTVGYDRASLQSGSYQGEITTDFYGRQVPKHAHGTINLNAYTSSTKTITAAAVELLERIMDKNLLSRRIGLCACHIVREEAAANERPYRQMSLFDLIVETENRSAKVETTSLQSEKKVKEHELQQTMVEIKKKFGKNAVIKAKNLNEGGTAILRNSQIGGHRA